MPWRRLPKEALYKIIWHSWDESTQMAFVDWWLQTKNPFNKIKKSWRKHAVPFLWKSELDTIDMWEQEYPTINWKEMADEVMNNRL